MSICPKLIGCFTPHVNWKALINLLTVEDAEGNQFFNICYNDRADCRTYESAFECLQNISFEEILKLIIVEDECGHPAINVVANICEECTEDIVQLP